MVRIRSFPIVLSCLYHFTWAEYDNVVQCIDIASSARVDVRAWTGWEEGRHHYFRCRRWFVWTKIDINGDSLHWETESQSHSRTYTRPGLFRVGAETDERPPPPK